MFSANTDTSAGTVGSPKRSSGAEAFAVDAMREADPVSQDDQQPEQHDGRGDEVPCQQAPSALVAHDHEIDGQPDGQRRR